MIPLFAFRQHFLVPDGENYAAKKDEVPGPLAAIR